MLIKRIFPLLSQTNNFVTYYKKVPPEAEKYFILVKKIKTALTLQQSLSIIKQDFQYIQQKGKTVILEFFNDYSYAQTTLATSKSKSLQLLDQIHQLLTKLQNLSFYQHLLKLSTLQRLFQYFELVQTKNTLFSTHIQQCATKILQLINNNQLDLYSGLNIISVFKIQAHPILISKALTLINKNINDYDIKEDMLAMWSIITYQISKIQWSQLRKYGNFIKFLTDDHHVNVNKKYIRSAKQFIISNIIELCKLSLHKVGLHRIPIFLKQAIQLIKQDISKLSPQTACHLLKSLSTLPLTFYPKVKNQLMKKILSSQNSDIKQNFPFSAFSTLQLNNYFCDRSKCNYLFHLIIYQITHQQLTYFYRGQILTHFQQLIQKISKAIAQKSYSFAQIKNASRYCHLCYIFYKHDKPTILQHLKQILLKYFKQSGLQPIINQFSFSHFITLLIIFQKDQVLFVKIKSILQKKINQLIHSSRFEKFTENALIAIENHSDTRSIIGKQMVLFFIKELIQNSSQFDFIVDRRILFTLLNSKQCSQYKPIKQSLLQKIKKPDLQCLIDYFILHHKKTFWSTKQIIKKMMNHKIALQQLIKFLSLINSKYLQNYKGKLQIYLSNYLLSYKQPIKSPLLILDQINKVLSLLMDYNFNKQFLKNIYQSTLQAIYHYLSTLKCQQSSYPIRLIIQFIFKFQQIFTIKQLVQISTKILLTKVYSILQLLIKDDTLYIKTRLLQFSYFYKQYAQIPQKLEIQLKSHIKQTLKTVLNSSQLNQIYFILLQLSCFQFISLQSKQQIQYLTIISQSINNYQLSTRQLRKFAKSILYHMQIHQINSKQLQLFNKIINPVFISSLHTLTFTNAFHTLKPFLQYFQKINQPNQMQQFCIKAIQNSPNLQQIQYFLSRFHYNKISTKLLQTILTKLQTFPNQLSSNTTSINILFYLQQIFFQTPIAYNKYFQSIWNFANKNIQYQISKIKSNTSSLNHSQKLYILGRYPLYMFSCIKQSNTQQNTMFSYLANYIRQNPKKFIQRINNNQFHKSINYNIAKYIFANEIIQQNSNILSLFPNNLIQITNTNMLSQPLKQQLIQSNIQHKFKWKIGRIIVPCYLPQQKQVILVVRYHKLNDLNTNIFLSGFHKFQLEIAKKLLPDYKIRIYNEAANTFYST